jgi:hypothetical protein
MCYSFVLFPIRKSTDIHKTWWHRQLSVFTHLASGDGFSFWPLGRPFLNGISVVFLSVVAYANSVVNHDHFLPDRLWFICSHDSIRHTSDIHKLLTRLSRTSKAFPRVTWPLLKFNVLSSIGINRPLMVSASKQHWVTVPCWPGVLPVVCFICKHWSSRPYIRKSWHYFANKRRSLGWHSSLADHSHGVSFSSTRHPAMHSGRCLLTFGVEKVWQQCYILPPQFGLDMSHVNGLFRGCYIIELLDETSRPRSKRWYYTCTGRFAGIAQLV